MSLFEELKRRNVFRVGIAYLVVGWMLLQVTDVVVPILAVPEWVSRLVLLLLALGFPVVLLLADRFYGMESVGGRSAAEIPVNAPASSLKSIAVLKRESIKRPPAAEIPFKCPPE